MKLKCFWFLVTLPLTWWGLAKVDFFYASLHDSIGIDKHIQRYAPYNRFNKRDFEKTTKNERVALFHGVVNAIHEKGKGLSELAYKQSNNQKVLLFTKAEVIHLQDVANLLEKIKPLIFVALILWMLALFWMLMKRMSLPPTKSLIFISALWLLIAFLILLSGPENVFNQLHIWAFPDDHQWFFYYEDSLMSTMMKAPQLFGYISAIWAILSILLSIILFKFMDLFMNVRRID